jgi:hypothetical protein
VVDFCAVRHVESRDVPGRIGRVATARALSNEFITSAIDRGGVHRRASAGAPFGILAIVWAVLGLVVFVPGSARGAERPAAQVRSVTAAEGSGVLLGVSCASAHACMAVGTHLTSGPAESPYTLAEEWNGTRWTVTRTRNPPSSLGNNLYGVSCSSASACMAVGAHNISHGSVPLAEAWNGNTWTVKATPEPDDDSSLDSVSCSSATACVATGFGIENGHNNWFSEVWNGQTWTHKTAPRPVDATYSSLGSVSCASAHFCVAVGDYQVNNSSKSQTLAETWDGQTWTINTTPNPSSGANGSELTGVSCTAPNTCMAVGHYNPPNAGGQTLAEIWNGITWAISPTGNNPSSAGGSLASVSCRSARACMAVGQYFTNSGSGGLAETWNGGIWTLKPVRKPGGAIEVDPGGVSCVSAQNCIAVGSYLTNTFSPEFPVAEAWNGKTWTTKITPL